MISQLLPPGGSVTLDTAGTNTSPLWQGWAEIISSGSIGGTAIFRKRLSASQDTEGAVASKPSSRGGFLLPFDNTGAYLTAMAIANPAPDQDVTISVVFRDELGRPIAVDQPTTFSLQRSSHEAFSLPDRFPRIAGRRGVAEFSAPGQDVAALGLRFQTQLNAFSSVETINLGATATTGYLPQIADGQGWKTSITLVNIDKTNPAIFDLRFWPGQDTPPTLPLQLEGRSLTNFTLTGVQIAPAGSVILETPGSAGGPLWQGWAEVTAPSGSISGLATFRKLILGNQYAEGSVAIMSGTATRLLLPFDNTQSFVTSVALANTSATTQDGIIVTLRDESGRSLGNVSDRTGITLGVHAHAAFGSPIQLQSTNNLRGVLDFKSSAGRLVGLGLRFNPRLAFTSLPVLRQ
jgi:hypothetical protein